MIGAAYAALQDWDAILWYDLAGSDWADSLAGPKKDNGSNAVFDVGSKPHLFNQFPAAALLFHRRDLVPLAETARVQVRTSRCFPARARATSSIPTTPFASGSRSSWARRPTARRPPGREWDLPGAGDLLVGAGGRAAGVGGAHGVDDRPLRRPDPAGRRRRNARRGPLLRHPCQLAGRQAAVVVRTPAGDHLGPGGEHGGGLSADRTRMTKLGHGPIRMEAVRGSLKLPGDGAFTVWPLSEDGARQAPLSVHEGPDSPRLAPGAVVRDRAK